MGHFTRWVRKIHTYTGLLNFSILFIFGVAGLTATLDSKGRPSQEVEYVSFQVPANLSDQEAARAAYAFLNLPLAHPLVSNTVRRDAANNVTFNDWTVNGPRVYTLLEKENRVRIERQRNRIWHYLDNLHSTTSGANSTDPRVRMWSWYTELAIWSLMFMSLSGLYLWLATRPRFRWGRISFVAGSGIFLILYAVTR